MPLFSHDTVDNALAAFTKSIARLRRVAGEHQAAANTISDKIDEHNESIKSMTTKRSEHTAEVVRAHAVADKFEAMLNG